MEKRNDVTNPKSDLCMRHTECIERSEEARVTQLLNAAEKEASIIYYVLLGTKELAFVLYLTEK